MKTKICSNKTEGQVLLVCVGIAAVLGISLAAIFSYTSNQFTAVARSQAWNESLVIAEAGVEDAMQFINKHSNTSTPGSSWYTSASADNWTNISANVYYVRRYIGLNYYDAYITNSNPVQPAIRVRGVKPWRHSTGGDNEVDRTVVVTTGSGSLFQGGVLAKGGITLNGNVVIDSYNSQNTNYSTGGQYNPAKRKDGGNIATVDSNIVATVSVGGSVDVFGKVYTGPDDGFSVVGGGTVGSLAWNATNTGVESGWSQNTLNMSIPDAQLPPGGTWSSLPTKTTYTLNGTNYPNSYLLTGSGNGQYMSSSSLGLSSSEKILIQGNVKLHMNAALSLSGNSQILIGTNSSLTIYASSSLDFSGGGVANGAGYATNLMIYGQTNNTSIKLAGGSQFIGVIYAPYAAYTQVGGGSTDLNFCGSIVANTVKLSGKSQIHYDESLLAAPAGPTYYVRSWKEL